MDNERIDRRLSPTDYAALVDAAKQRALELRLEAIGDFWAGITGRCSSRPGPRQTDATSPSGAVDQRRFGRAGATRGNLPAVRGDVAASASSASSSPRTNAGTIRLPGITA